MFHLLVALVLLLPLASDGWPTGAPVKACQSMMPKHGNNAAKPATQSPFSFKQSSDTYRAGDQVIVYVQAPSGIPFRGMMVQAYDPRTNETIGDFLDGNGLKVLAECASISHSDKEAKKSATLVWVAPDSSGSVKFRATIVKEFNTFYHGIPAVVEN